MDKIKSKIMDKIEKLKQAIEEINLKVGVLDQQRSESEAKRKAIV